MKHYLNPQERWVAWLQTPLRPLAYRLLRLYGACITRHTIIGNDFRLEHGGVGVVIHPVAVIGDRVKIFHGVTIGRSDQYLRRDQLEPNGGVTIEDDVVVGAGAQILFSSRVPLVIGERAVIGANSVVTKSVPVGEIWAGNPARFIRRNPNA